MLTERNLKSFLKTPKTVVFSALTATLRREETQVEDKRCVIGVFGHHGHENLGDEAITTAVIQNIYMRFPNATVVGFSADPQDTRTRYSIAAHPIQRFSGKPAVLMAVANGASRYGSFDSTATHADTPIERAKAIIKRIPGAVAVVRFTRWLRDAVLATPVEILFLYRSYRAVKPLDLLIIAGSNQFLDNFGGPWGFPCTLLKWTLLARTARVPVAYMSVGAGPLDGRLSKLFVRLALKLSDYRSYRDVGSQRLIHALGYRGKDQVVPDLAHSLLLDVRLDRQTDAGAKVIGINPMPVYHPLYWPIVDRERYAAYVEALTRFAQSLIHAGHRVTFFATQPMDKHVIREVCDMLAGRQAPGFDCKAAAQSPSQVMELIDALQGMDIVVATRFHGVLLPLSLGRPVIAIAYDRKTHELMQDTGQGDYVVDLESCSPADLERRLNRLIERIDIERDLIKEHGARYQAALAAQYQAVFALMECV